jgi:PTH1 family peptidyl-tRNA hydrolase
VRFFSRGEAPRADRLVVGLGNPGEEYARTRHNVGYQVANRLAKRMRAEFKTKAADARIAEGTLGTMRVAVARPGTFMNDSGHSVRRLLQRYRLEPKDLVVVYDDIDLPLGRIRIRPSGGPGTHNGMRSVVAEIESEAFPRVRLGIHQEGDHGDLVDHVLSPFRDDEAAKAEQMVTRAAESIEVLLRDGIERAMAKFNADLVDAADA